MLCFGCQEQALDRKLAAAQKRKAKDRQKERTH